jgi:hypothetical protein
LVQALPSSLERAAAGGPAFFALAVAVVGAGVAVVAGFCVLIAWSAACDGGVGTARPFARNRAFSSRFRFADSGSQSGHQRGTRPLPGWSNVSPQVMQVPQRTPFRGTSTTHS